jgi:hypothetical protein
MINPFDSSSRPSGRFFFLTFTYNFLNLPEQVKAGSTVKAYYLYDATGRKLNTRNPSQTTSYDYMDSLVLAQVNGGWSGEVNFGEGDDPQQRRGDVL